MRKLTIQAAEAFFAGCNYRRNNTCVSVADDKVILLLHGIQIAQRDVQARRGVVVWTMAGWPSATTRERLNGVLPGGISQQRYHQIYIAPTGRRYDISPSLLYKATPDALYIKVLGEWINAPSLD